MMPLTPVETIRKELKNINRKIDAAERKCKREGPLETEEADNIIILVGWRSALEWTLGVLSNDK